MRSRRRRSETAVDEELVELAAVADGSLSAERSLQLEVRVAASSELSGRLAEQQRAIALTRSAVAAVEVPQGLRRRIAAQRQQRRTRSPRRFAIAGVAAGAASAVAIAAVALVSAGSPAGFHAALAPTNLVSGAGGEATLRRSPSGWRIQLDAAGLPRLADGAFYEAWLRNDAGLLVPVGTFNDGRAVTLWAGVAPTQFTTLTVTRERANRDQGSSGEKVLVGTVTRGG